MLFIRALTAKGTVAASFAAAMLLSVFAAAYFIPAFATDGGNSSGMANVTPENISITLWPGESIIENKTVTVIGLPPGPVDVFFIFDLTASMGPVLDTAKARSLDVMNNISALTGNAAFGVGSLMDYSGAFNSCGYEAFYGSGADYPWSLDRDVTLDKDAVSAAINSLGLGNGNDGPESYARALYESQFVSWRPDAKRIVVIFEDNIPHDCSMGDYGCGASTGVDPGRDALAGTADDLTWSDVIAQLKAAGIEVVTVDSGGGFSCDGPWLYAVNQSSGLFVQLDNVSELPERIVASVENLTRRVRLTLVPEAGFENWVGWAPDSYSGVGINETVNFVINFTVPNGTAAGNYTFVINITGDNMTLATQNVTINVTAVDTQPPIITKTVHGPQFGICPPQGNQTCYIQDHITSIIMNASDSGPNPAVTCNWSVTGPDSKSGSGTPPFNITIKKDSLHAVTITCKDSFNNTAIDNETFHVDSIPPITTSTFSMPRIVTGDIIWITNQTNITLDASDNKTGVDKIYYRISLVNSTYCDGINATIGDNLACTDAPAPDSFFDIFAGLIRIAEQSCHLIEYYSMDKLGNNESSPLNQTSGEIVQEGPTRQCAFVDNIDNIARYLARAGIEWAFDQLVAASGQTNGWNTMLATNGGVMATNMTLPDNPGTFSVTVRNDNQPDDNQITGEPVDIGNDTTDTNGILIVTSTGTVNGVSRQVQVVVKRLQLPPFQGALNQVGVQVDTYFNTASFDIDGRDYVCAANCDNPASWAINPDQGSMRYGIQVLPGIQRNTGRSYEQMVEYALNSLAKRNNVKGKDQTNPGGPSTTGLNTVAPDGQLNLTVMNSFLTKLANHSATTVLQSTRACPMVMTGEGQPTNTPVLTNRCGLNQTLDLGTMANPKLVYIRGELDPSSMFTALRIERAVKGAGILVVEDGDLRINGNNLWWDGLILVAGRYVEASIRGNNMVIYGEFAVMESIWNEPRGFFEMLVMNVTSLTMRFSQQNLNMVQGMRALHSITSWREL